MSEASLLKVVRELASQAEANAEALKGLVLTLEESRADSEAGDKYYHQGNSPLGKDQHLRLCRAGLLPSTKAGKRVLVTRVDMERHLEAQRVSKARAVQAIGNDDSVAAELDALMAQRAKRGRR
jgi:hypothetical protein